MRAFNIIVCFLVLILNQGTSLFFAQDKTEEPPVALMYPTQQLKRLPCPKRITTDFTGRLTAQSVLSESIPGYFSKEGVALTYEMARGNYDEVIASTQKSIKENFPWQEGKSWKYGGQKDHLKVAEMQRLMANAYELKGDWENAFRAYETFLGELSDNYEWICLRRLFIENEDSLRLALLNRVIEFRTDGEEENARRLVEAIRRGEEKYDEEVKRVRARFPNINVKKEVGRNFCVPRDLEPTWRRIWTFRDRCVRALCPEIYYVTTLIPQEGVRSFPDLQKETFERLIEMENDYYVKLAEAYGTSSDSTPYKKGVDFLRLLNEIPYDLSPNGLYYEREVNTGVAVPYGRGDIQPFIIEK